MLVALLGTYITEKVVVPRFGEYRGEEKAEELKELSPREKRGLWLALATALVLVGVVLWGLVPADGFLRDPKTGGVLQSPFLSGIVAIIFFGGALVGLAYGLGAGTIRSDSDVMKSMEKAMATMSLYLVLAFYILRWARGLHDSAPALSATAAPSLGNLIEGWLHAAGYLDRALVLGGVLLVARGRLAPRRSRVWRQGGSPW